MIKSIKVMLIPNNKQRTILFRFAAAARYTYNWALEKERDNHELGGKFISDGELRKQFTYFKRMRENSWLNKISNNVTKQAIKDACDAYKKFFKKLSSFPRFKSRKHTKPSFYQDTAKIKFTSTHVKLESISNSKKRSRQRLNWIRLAEHDRIPVDAKYMNPRITYDGLNWWVSVSIEYPDASYIPSGEGIGIDLGIKDFAICSNNIVYKNINKTSCIRKIKKKQRRLQRKISRKYQKNKKGKSYCKTKNVIKLEKLLLKINHRLSNIRKNYLHQVSTEIIRREPSFICLEDLNVSGMMKNKHLSRAVQEQNFYNFRQIIEYKSKEHNINIVFADRFYPSSKTCSCCGYIKKDLKLSDRVYICPECGNTIDRDLQAAINLKKYGENNLHMNT